MEGSGGNTYHIIKTLYSTDVLVRDAPSGATVVGGLGERTLGIEGGMNSLS